MRARRRSPAVWFLVIAGIAFVLRLIHLLQLRNSDPLFLSPQMDSLYHHQWALAIAARREFIAEAFFRAPLYPYFLGLLYKLFGANLMAVRTAQALLGSASCGLTYLLARRLLDRPQAAGPKPQASLKPHRLTSSDVVARSAGFVMAAYPLAIWFDGELLIASLLTFLLLLGFVLLLRSRDTDRQWWLPGLVFGLAAIARPNVLAFLAVLPVWLFLEYRRGAWKRLAQVWGVAVLIILPVTVRNYVVSRQFVPIAWQAGTNFYIGNSAESDGMTAIVPGTRGSWWGGYDDVRRLAEEAAGRPLKGAEIDRYWMGKGLEFWRRQPGKALGLLLRKAFLWFSGYEVANDRDFYAVKRFSFINYLLFNSRFLKFPFGLLLPLALAGTWLWRRQWRRFLTLYLLVGVYSLSFIVFFVCSRFRMPIVPVGAILAVMGLTELVGPVGRAGRVSGRGVALAIAVAAFLLFNANLAGAGRKGKPDQNHYDAAVGLHGQGRDAEALAEVRQALKLDSATNVLSLEATLLATQGDHGKAERAARAAVRLHPSDAEAYGTLGNVLAASGRLDSAAVCFETVRDLDPYSFQAWNDLGNIALMRRDFAKARLYYEGALKIRPTFAPAAYHLGLCEYQEGNVEEARRRWQEVLRLDPSFAKAKEALEHLK
jgi:4-amino-4-deoxy-L-arabinose transferase-like glycosyltransferase